MKVAVAIADQLITVLSLVLPTFYAICIFVAVPMCVSACESQSRVDAKSHVRFCKTPHKTSIYISCSPIGGKMKDHYFDFSTIIINLIVSLSYTGLFMFFLLFSRSSGVVVLLRPTMMIKRKTKHSRWLFFQPAPMHKHLQSK